MCLISMSYFQWSGGKVVLQRQDIFVKGHSAAQVVAGYSNSAVVTTKKRTVHMGSKFMLFIYYCDQL